MDAVWKAVRQVTGTKHSVIVADGISAESLNDHYANISTDQDYSHPKHRSTCSVENQEFVSEWTVFQMLDKLRPTSTGLDCLRAWFLKLGAPVFCKPIAYLFNLSITECFVPQQWNTAWISPIPKVPVPKSHPDYRPISISSILSRITERLVVRQFLYPAFSIQSSVFSDHMLFALPDPLPPPSSPSFKLSPNF